jgi:hypothetical protein
VIVPVIATCLVIAAAQTPNIAINIAKVSDAIDVMSLNFLFIFFSFFLFLQSFKIGRMAKP